MDTFIAALKVGCTGSCCRPRYDGRAAREAERLRDETRFANVMYVKGCIEEIPLADARFDTVISNAVIKLSADKCCCNDGAHAHAYSYSNSGTDRCAHVVRVLPCARNRLSALS